MYRKAEPSLLLTRWQGIATARGLLAQALATDLPRFPLSTLRASSSSLTASFGLKARDDTTRMKTEDTLVKLGAKQVNGRILVSLPSDVLFDFDKSNIRPDAEATLSQLSRGIDHNARQSRGNYRSHGFEGER